MSSMDGGGPLGVEPALPDPVFGPVSVLLAPPGNPPGKPPGKPETVAEASLRFCIK